MHDDEESTGLSVGDCQNVLFKVTVPPTQVETVSEELVLSKLTINIIFIHLLTQQTPPKRQDPLGCPPNIPHTFPGVQMPDWPFGEVQLSNVVSKFGKLGLSWTGLVRPSWANGLGWLLLTFGRLPKRRLPRAKPVVKPRSRDAASSSFPNELIDELYSF